MTEKHSVYVVTVGDNVATLHREQAVSLHKQLTKLIYPVEDDIATIKRTLARHFQVRVRDIDSHIRTKPTLWARWMAMYLCKTMLGMNNPQIAQHFGGRDPSGLLHVWEEVDKRIKDRPVFVRELELVKKQLLEAGVKETIFSESQPQSELDRIEAESLDAPGGPSGKAQVQADPESQ